MPVTYTTPVATPDETISRVSVIWADAEQRRADISVQRVNAVGEIRRTDVYTVGDDSHDFTWEQFISNVPSLGTLRQEIEVALIAAGEIPPGTVT